MKKALLLFLLWVVAMRMAAQSCNSFSPQMCGNSGSNVFTYENFQVGSHGSGFNILRNGQVVFSKSGDGIYSSSFTCRDIHFINPSTGFAYIYGSLAYANLYITTDAGTNWTHFTSFYWGGGCPDYYIVNEHYAYLISGSSSVNRIWAINDIYNTEQVLVNDTVLSGDVFLTDTVYGMSVCPQDSLAITITNSGTPITYHITFVYDITGIDDVAAKQPGVDIFPNPAQGYFTLNTAQQIKQVCLYNATGRVVRNYAVEATNRFDVSGLAGGIYYIAVQTTGGETRKKLFIGD